ncbi:hypothetical protein CMUS01_02113 [Colletotrichum musicola]|uniref:Uncharacterized protein n=1 Tax=Colletotrichum musicola TaxID=2175873 RepID=A0A8H6NVX0_9PEZI|nr:hypothetical protein CMUS01_02113 [Colletotrichum musicola]
MCEGAFIEYEDCSCPANASVITKLCSAGVASGNASMTCRFYNVAGTRKQPGKCFICRRRDEQAAEMGTAPPPTTGTVEEIEAARGEHYTKYMNFKIGPRKVEPKKDWKGEDFPLDHPEQQEYANWLAKNPQETPQAPARVGESSASAQKAPATHIPVGDGAASVSEEPATPAVEEDTATPAPIGEGSASVQKKTATPAVEEETILPAAGEDPTTPARTEENSSPFRENSSPVEENSSATSDPVQEGTASFDKDTNPTAAAAAAADPSPPAVVSVKEKKETKFKRAMKFCKKPFKRSK